MSNDTQPLPLTVIADDEELGRLLLAESAQAVGLQALAFDNGSDALAAALERPATLVLLDVDMPGMDGYQVCRQLRAQPQYALVPIVMVTSHEDPESIRRAFDAGATDFIAKPVNWALLPRRLEYILRNAAAARRIEQLAYFDTLTGLPNRQRCMDIAHGMFAGAARHDERVAIMYLDLNSLKRVNDTFGHTTGDAVLKAFGLRLADAASWFGLAERLAVTRFGGDEFVIALRDADARSQGLRLAQACVDVFKRPIRHDALEFYASPSIGIAIYPDDGADVATVLKHADTAMHQARAETGGAIASYTPAMSSRMRDWLELEGRLRRAVHDDLLHLVYQPKFRLSDHRIVGVEALLRWRDAEYGDISPTRIVEIAEGSGLILEMSSWVIRTVCRQLRRWLDRGLALPVAINISGHDLLHGDPAALVAAAAAAAGIPASLIEIELTESVLIGDTAAVQDALQKLRQLGCRIALDDFGTGYSSLAYVSRFPPDRIKIDKAFVRDVDRSPRDAAIASAILSLSASLNVTVTAEGVERREQLEWLRERGCQEIQGFLLSPPLLATDLEARLLNDSPPKADASTATSAA